MRKFDLWCAEAWVLLAFVAWCANLGSFGISYRCWSPSPLESKAGGPVYSFPHAPTGVAALLAALSLACSANSQAPGGTPSHTGASKPVACTMMFAVIGIRVTDAALRPVPDAEVTVTRKSTGETRTSTPSGAGGNGGYTIADDSMREGLAAEGEPFEITARAGGKRAVASVTIGLTEGRCHVARLAGPETLVLQ